ncbi:hypothetical protein [Gimesia aquarii]|uniref:hypothetical protein n=1 Tax=Gimesia aquarii TaxID=2527964 RepID=UPI0011A53216|nr:hypothetical protein [Gimesia aquarii]
MIRNSIALKFSITGRPKRAAQAGFIYHSLNQTNARMTIFESDEDYAALFDDRLELFTLNSFHFPRLDTRTLQVTVIL